MYTDNTDAGGSGTGTQRAERCGAARRGAALETTASSPDSRRRIPLFRLEMICALLSDFGLPLCQSIGWKASSGHDRRHAGYTRLCPRQCAAASRAEPARATAIGNVVFHEGHLRLLGGKIGFDQEAPFHFFSTEKLVGPPEGQQPRGNDDDNDDVDDNDDGTEKEQQQQQQNFFY